MRLSPPPLAEDQGAEREAEAERAHGERADRERLPRGREPLPAAEHLALLVGERLAATLLPHRAAGAEAEVEIVEDFGRFVHFKSLYSLVRRA